MIIHLIAVGTRFTAWAEMAFQDYQKRLSAECKLKLIPIPISKRHKNSLISEHIAEEAKKILTDLPKHSRVIALDVKGMWSTQQLAQSLQQWQLERQDIGLLIGGPDSLGDTCINHAERIWSLLL